MAGDPARDAAGRAADVARARLALTARTQQRVAEECSAAIARAATMLTACFTGGGTLLLCGNGGSAADCQHLAAEFVSRRRHDRWKSALPALALTTDTSVLTAYANDWGYDGVFARQVEALGRPGDVLIAISTSGASINVMAAVHAARERRVTTVGLLGEGGPLTGMVDHAVVVPTRDTQLVQECLLGLEHVLCDLVDEQLTTPRTLPIAQKSLLQPG